MKQKRKWEDNIRMDLQIYQNIVPCLRRCWTPIDLLRLFISDFTSRYYSLSGYNEFWPSDVLSRSGPLITSSSECWQLTDRVTIINWLKVKVTLRLTVSQSVSLGVEPHLGLMTRYLAITTWQLRSCFCGALSLTRGRVCLLYMLLGLPNAVLLTDSVFVFP
jgi:hypothetical protein